MRKTELLAVVAKTLELASQCTLGLEVAGADWQILLNSRKLDMNGRPQWGMSITLSLSDLKVAQYDFDPYMESTLHYIHLTTAQEDLVRRELFAPLSGNENYLLVCGLID